MSQSFREELRRALAADALTPEPGFEDRLLGQVRDGLEHPPRWWRRRLLRSSRDTDRLSPAWALVAAIVAVIAIATLLLSGQVARSRTSPAGHPAPSATPTPTPVDPAVTRYRALVEADFAPLRQAGDLSGSRCGVGPTPSCRTATVQARQSAQAFLDALKATSPPPSLQEAHDELVEGLTELLPAYDAQLAAIDAGDAGATNSRALASSGIKGQKVYHGVADAKCWPRRAVRGSDTQLSWVCPSS